MLEQLAHGQAPVVVGTHALFQDDVVFQRLGLIIVDEQHRFGVHQRLSLADKGAGGQHPHQLALTATPIPSLWPWWPTATSTVPSLMNCLRADSR